MIFAPRETSSARRSQRADSLGLCWRSALCGQYFFESAKKNKKQHADTPNILGFQLANIWPKITAHNEYAMVKEWERM
jgi:hypothetical protein